MTPPPSPRWRRLYAVAASQRGLLASRQAREVGLDPAVVRRRARREDWRKVGPGVWLVAGAPRPDHLRLRTALLVVGGDVAATRWTAARVHGLDVEAGPVQLVVPARRRAPALVNVEVLRSRTLDADQVRTVDGITVVAPARLPADLAAVASREALWSLLVDLRQRHLAQPAEVAQHLLRAGNVAGGRVLRQLLVELDGVAVDSAFEAAVASWLRANGVAVATQHRLETASASVTLDLALVDRRVAIECDGFAHHRTPDQLDRDHRRQNAIHRAGWTVLRVSWRRFAEDRPGFLAEVRAVAAAAA